MMSQPFLWYTIMMSQPFLWYTIMIPQPFLWYTIMMSQPFLWYTIMMSQPFFVIYYNDVSRQPFYFHTEIAGDILNDTDRHTLSEQVPCFLHTTWGYSSESDRVDQCYQLSYRAWERRETIFYYKQIRSSWKLPVCDPLFQDSIHAASVALRKSHNCVCSLC